MQIFYIQHTGDLRSSRSFLSYIRVKVYKNSWAICEMSQADVLYKFNFQTFLTWNSYHEKKKVPNRSCWTKLQLHPSSFQLGQNCCYLMKLWKGESDCTTEHHRIILCNQTLFSRQRKAWLMLRQKKGQISRLFLWYLGNFALKLGHAVDQIHIYQWPHKTKWNVSFISIHHWI